MHFVTITSGSCFATAMAICCGVAVRMWRNRTGNDARPINIHFFQPLVVSPLAELRGRLPRRSSQRWRRTWPRSWPSPPDWPTSATARRPPDSASPWRRSPGSPGLVGSVQCCIQCKIRQIQGSSHKLDEHWSSPGEQVQLSQPKPEHSANQYWNPSQLVERRLVEPLGVVALLERCQLGPGS